MLCMMLYLLFDFLVSGAQFWATFCYAFHCAVLLYRVYKWASLPFSASLLLVIAFCWVYIWGYHSIFLALWASPRMQVEWGHSLIHMLFTFFLNLGVVFLVNALFTLLGVNE